MSHDDEGFLSTEANQFAGKHRARYHDLFRLAEDLNRFAHQIKFELDVKDRDIQAIICFCLYMRILDSFAATIRLAEVGLWRDAEATARISLESLFYLKRCSESEEFVLEFVKSDQLTRLKIMNVAKNPKSPLHGIINLDPEKFDKIHQQLKEEVESEELTEHKVIQVARDAKMEETYDYAYRHLSRNVHPHPRSLSEYGIWDKDDNLVGLTLGPNEDKVPSPIFTGISILLFTTKIIAVFFKKDMAPLAQLEDRYKSLDKNVAMDTEIKSNDKGQS